jgi:hypothetical protein
MATTPSSPLIGPFYARPSSCCACFPRFCALRHTPPSFLPRGAGGVFVSAPLPLTSPASGAHSPDHIARSRSSSSTPVRCARPPRLPRRAARVPAPAHDHPFAQPYPIPFCLRDTSLTSFPLPPLSHCPRHPSSPPSAPRATAKLSCH